MNQEFILGKLSELMSWDTSRSRDEFAWLRLMSKMKYDGYQDFRAGARFIESLASWLQQFESRDEREVAYRFVRDRLAYVSPGEMNHLVELLFPETVHWRLMSEATSRAGCADHLLWANADASRLYWELLRKSLFVELSDGARIDVFRRANAGRISNEQIVTAPRINAAKWDDLLTDLRESLEDDKARFAFVFLVDDFTASGTTLLRWEEDKQSWNGKLFRFWEDIEELDAIEQYFEPEWTLCVHHYLATSRAKRVIEERQSDAAEQRKKNGQGWFGRVQFSYGASFDSRFPVTAADSEEFVELARRYYDPSIETKHMRKGGSNAQLGFGECALPLILEHNTPNNSVSLLWAETDGANGAHAMRPLFRRRQRHT